eukprot:IDg2513t1
MQAPHRPTAFVTAPYLPNHLCMRSPNIILQNHAALVCIEMKKIKSKGYEELPGGDTQELRQSSKVAVAEIRLRFLWA